LDPGRITPPRAPQPLCSRRPNPLFPCKTSSSRVNGRNHSFPPAPFPRRDRGSLGQSSLSHMRTGSGDRPHRGATLGGRPLRRLKGPFPTDSHSIRRLLEQRALGHSRLPARGSELKKTGGQSLPPARFFFERHLFHQPLEGVLRALSPRHWPGQSGWGFFLSGGAMSPTRKLPGLF